MSQSMIRALVALVMGAVAVGILYLMLTNPPSFMSGRR
jgi:hypothetical protein